MGAHTSSVLVNLVFGAGGDNVTVGDAVAALEVVSDDADALAENVIVYLIIWAGDGGWRGAGCRRSIGGGYGGGCGGSVPASEVGRVCRARAVNVNVALVSYSVV